MSEKTVYELHLRFRGENLSPPYQEPQRVWIDEYEDPNELADAVVEILKSPLRDAIYSMEIELRRVEGGGER